VHKASPQVAPGLKRKNCRLVQRAPERVRGSMGEKRDLRFAIDRGGTFTDVYAEARLLLTSPCANARCLRRVLELGKESMHVPLPLPAHPAW